MEGFWCGKQALVRSVDLKVLCNVTLRTVSGWEHSSTKQLERVPRGSFGGATCKYTVSASIIDRSRAVIEITATSNPLVAFLFTKTLLDTFCTWWYNYLIKSKEISYATRKN